MFIGPDLTERQEKALQIQFFSAEIGFLLLMLGVVAVGILAVLIITGAFS